MSRTMSRRDAKAHKTLESFGSFNV